MLERWPSAGGPHAEPVIQCRIDQGDIKLTESLAAPFIRAREVEFKRLEAGLREREAALEVQIAERVATARKKVEEPGGRPGFRWDHLVAVRGTLRNFTVGERVRVDDQSLVVEEEEDAT